MGQLERTDRAASYIFAEIKGPEWERDCASRLPHSIQIEFGSALGVGGTRSRRLFCFYLYSPPTQFEWTIFDRNETQFCECVCVGSLDISIPFRAASGLGAHSPVSGIESSGTGSNGCVGGERVPKGEQRRGGTTKQGHE